jgi:hypothetical protein
MDEMKKFFLLTILFLVLTARIVYGQEQIKAVVLKSAGSDLPLFWDHLNDNWLSYGETEIIIDYSSLNWDGITYSDIAATQAQVLIIDDARNPLLDQIFTPEEVSAIIQYIDEGHGLIITGGTFRPEEHWPLLTILGLSQQAGGQVYYGLCLPIRIDIIIPYYPLFNQLPVYFSASNNFYSGSDWDSDGNWGYASDWEFVLEDPNADIVGHIWYAEWDINKISPIIRISKTNYKAVFAGHNPANYSPTIHDYQFYYNMILDVSTSGDGDRCFLIISTTEGGTSNPAPGKYNYERGTQVQVEAIPDDCNKFSHWTGDVPQGTEHDNPITLTIDSDKSITANFIITYQLNISAVKGGTTEPAPGTHIYDSGTEVTVTAIPDENYEFNGWSGDISGTENPIIIAIDQDKWITPSFSSLGEEKSFWELDCFIATAVCGSPLHPYVGALRDFRDKYLMPSKFGRKIVSFYYKYSPFVADVISKNKILKAAVRQHLLPLVAFSYAMVHLGPMITALILIFVFILPFFLASSLNRKSKQVK